jgi:hypothetical protein
MSHITLNATPWFPSYSAHKAYQQKDFDQAQEILEQKQVEAPNNPLINYNLGTIYYKKGDIAASKESFARAATHAFSSNKNILAKSRFNLGNCFYKKTLELLPHGWEEKPENISDDIRKQAIKEIKQSIEQYKNSLKIEKNNERTKTNQKAAEEILKKLEKNKNKNKNKQNKKNNKDKKNQDKKENKNQNKKDQNKKEKENENKDREKQKEQKKQKPKENRKQNLDKRRTEAVLAKLEQNEKNLQKKLFKQKAKADGKPKNKYQKPW